MPVARRHAAGSVLLVLGGTAFQVPAILHALKLGCKVITCDYLPHNPGHRLAHRYVNASTTDADAVLAVAREHGVDGVLAYASDPAAATAAAVAAQLQLPCCPLQAVNTLTNKVLFRSFLRDHGFRTPRFAAARNLEQTQAVVAEIGFPVAIKPVDSSGSKGVSRVDERKDVVAGFEYALEYSRSGEIIVEEWTQRTGVQIAGDGLIVDGKLVFGGFGDEHFDLQCSAHAPVGESLPGQLSGAARTSLLAELQRLFELLGVRHLVFNLDAMLDAEGRPFIIEIGPRAGGNALPQLIQRSTGVDLTQIAIRQALGMDVPASMYRGKTPRCVASHMLHSRHDGRFAGFRMAPSLQPHAVEVVLTAHPGDAVRRFASSRDTLGYALFEFPDADTMSRMLPAMSDAFVPVIA